MRKNKQLSKPIKKHSLSERAHLRALKRRSGPSGLRRKERRADLQRKEPPEPDGETFRGGEAAGFASEQQAAAQRLK